ncbi:hypothetical protein E1285_32110 [Actinomadura sp. 7K507]|nr:hypothetical protein E1285_32110 [Actinomadura sp. 7K507]
MICFLFLSCLMVSHACRLPQLAGRQPTRNKGPTMTTAALAPETPTLVLEPSDQAPGLARRFLMARFRELGITDDYIGRLVVTELVTNVHKHVGFGHIVVRVFPDKRDDLIVIEVQDEGAGLPVVGAEDHDATSGRGLLLMAQLVHDWGVRPLTRKERPYGLAAPAERPGAAPPSALAHQPGPCHGHPLPGPARRHRRSQGIQVRQALPGRRTPHPAPAALGLRLRPRTPRPHRGERPRHIRRHLGLPRGRARQARLSRPLRRHQVRR